MTAVVLLATTGEAGAAVPARAPELVTPGDGNMGDVLRVTGVSDSGETALSVASAGLDTSRSAMFITAIRSARGSSGWQAESADPVAAQHMSAFTRLFRVQAISADEKRILVNTFSPLDPLDGDDTWDLYLVDVATGAATWISHPGANGTDGGDAPYFLGASRDLRTIYFSKQNIAGFVSGAPDSALYRWRDGEVTVASVAPGDVAIKGDWVAFPRQVNRYKSWLNYEFGPQPAHGGSHPASDDGSTFFFLNDAFGAVLYARSGGATVAVNTSQETGHIGEQPAPATFVGASHDGDLVYFVENARLTDAGTAGGGLFSYRISTDELTQLTPDAGDPSGLGVTDAIMSDDASHVYFVATAALTPAAQSGQPNVYVYSEGSTRLIATVPAGARIERSSRSGRFVVIQTTGSIGGAPVGGQASLYEYDDHEGSIACVSCRTDGSTSQAAATLDDEGTPFSLNGSPMDSASRNISDDGRVFFASHDRLVADDLNHAADVYEYADGELQLISSGTDPYDSYVQDNSDDGQDAFFITHASLVGADRDKGLADLYDARIGGGFPEAPEQTPPCDGSDCQGTAAAPSLTTPATDRAATPPLFEVPPVKPAVKKGFEVERLSAAARRRLAKGRAISLAVVMTGGGRVTVTSSAKIGRRRLSAGSARATVLRRSTVTAHIRFKLNRAALARLAHRGSLRLTMTVRVSGIPGTKRLSVPLTRFAR